jgi:hypothetical protein
LTKDQNDDQKKTMDIISNLHAYLKDIYQKQNAIEDGADRIRFISHIIRSFELSVLGGVAYAGF